MSAIWFLLLAIDIQRNNNKVSWVACYDDKQVQLVCGYFVTCDLHILAPLGAKLRPVSHQAMALLKSSFLLANRQHSSV